MGERAPGPFFSRWKYTRWVRERLALTSSLSSNPFDASPQTACGVYLLDGLDSSVQVFRVLICCALCRLSDVEVQNARGQRKALVRRCEALATAAAELEQQAKAAESQQPNA